MPKPKLARRLGTFDATLIVMGGIVGSGIFMNPSVVAARVHTAPLILTLWIFGGFIALIGGFVFAELARLRPDAGGLYGWMRDGVHPSVGFMYGWTALLVSQSGGMAAAAITFSAYISPLFPLHVPTWTVASAIVAVLSLINCLGVRQGGTTQNAFMVLKIAAIAALIVVGLFATPHAVAQAAAPAASTSGLALLAMLGAALIPVFFSYDGAQTAPFMDHETRDPGRTFPRALVLGVVGVVALYVLVNISALRMLGAAHLAQTTTPAADIMRLALGPVGANLVAVAVALSTLGFLSNQILISPRIYFDMAADGLFFKQLAYVHPVTRAPVVAIAVQAVVAIALTTWGRYDQILTYVVSMDFVFFSLAVFAVFRLHRAKGDAAERTRIPLHPYSTVLFLTVNVALYVSAFYSDWRTTSIGAAILLSGIPAYILFARTVNGRLMRKDRATPAAETGIR